MRKGLSIGLLSLFMLIGLNKEVFAKEKIMTSYMEYVESLNFEEINNHKLLIKNDKLFGEKYESFKNEGAKNDGFDDIDSLTYLKSKTSKNYEVIESHNSGEYTYLTTADSLNEAMEKADKLNEEDIIKEDSVTAVIDKYGKIVYSPMAMGRVIKHKNGKPYRSSNLNSDIYEDKELKKVHSFINHQYIDDVPIIEDKGKVARIQVAGYNGYINKDFNSEEYDMVILPVNQVKTPSHYENVNGRLIHFVSKDITSESPKGLYLENGIAPDYLKQGKKYYSYDGNYFYESLTNLLLDLKEGNFNRAINKDNKYLSEYLNLSFESKTTLTASDLNKFINENTKADSKLRGTGESFIAAQNNYNVNALTMLSIAINESSWGMSSIAKEKNNLFGINAIDATPGSSAGSFSSPAHCINDFAKNYISDGYSNPEDWRYKGAYLGNKSAGANVNYASDPYWGEKAASVMYRVDGAIK